MPSNKSFHVVFEDSEDRWGSYKTYVDAYNTIYELLEEGMGNTPINIEFDGFVIDSFTNGSIIQPICGQSRPLRRRGKYHARRN